MKFEVKATLKYQIFTEGTIILNVHALADAHQRILKESFLTQPEIKIKESKLNANEGRIISLELLPNTNLTVSYQAEVENACIISDYDEVEDLNIAKLPADVLIYLNPSRYCQSDKLYRLANNMFGYKGNDFEKVMALTHWIHLNVEYLSGSTNAQTSAYETITEQAGVCRDFAHLGISLCRALTIPARYFTGYSYQLYPPDFHACFEAYINGKWLLFDATRLAPLNGMVKIATGKDAADTAIANIFGEINFVASEVSCNLIDTGFEAFKPDYLSKKGICFL